jgi:uncharacterized protein (TIGR02231 family)
MSEVGQKLAAEYELITEEQGNQIVEVTVFTDQAYLKRRAKARAKAGANRFLLAVQSFSIDSNSVQASIYGLGEIVSVRYKEIPVKDAPQQELNALESQKDQLILERKRLKLKKEINDKQLRLLDSMAHFGEAELPKKSKTRFPEPETLKAMLVFLEENYTTLTQKNLEIELKMEELDKELSVIDRNLKNLKRGKDKSQKVIEVLFNSASEQEIIIEAAYIVHYASWTPIYRVDVPLDLSHVKLTLFAQIQQKTGEHWTNAKIAVSNAIPLRGAALPELRSWYINYAPAPMPISVRQMSEDTLIAENKSGEGLRSLAEEIGLEEEMDYLEIAGDMQEAHFSEAHQKALPLAFEFELPERFTIESGDSETLLLLSTTEFKGQFFYYCVPRIEQVAYLVAQITPENALLSGRLNVHLAGRFISGTLLTEKQAGQNLLINLGADGNIKTTLQKVSDKLSESFFGMIDRYSTAREVAFRIIVENLKNEKIRMNLLDCLPVSKTDRIQVKGAELAPQPTIRDYQKKEGVMLWDFELKPKAVKEILCKFYVKHPKDTPPVGL